MTNAATLITGKRIIYTNPHFRRTSIVGVVISLCLFFASLALPVLNVGGYTPEDAGIPLPGFIWIVAISVIPPTSIPNTVLVLSSLLLLRRFNGLLVLRCLVVSAYWLWILYFAVTFPRALYVGFWYWISAITVAVIAHWLTLTGNMNCFADVEGYHPSRIAD